MTFVPYNSYPSLDQEMYDLLDAFLSEDEFNAFMADYTPYEGVADDGGTLWIAPQGAISPEEAAILEGYGIDPNSLGNFYYVKSYQSTRPV